MKKCFILIIVTILLGGCSARNEITKYSQITYDKPDKLIIFCKDSSFITLDQYFFESDSIIRGIGLLEKNGITDFRGDIKLSEINYIAGESSSFFRGLVTAALIGTVAVVFLSESEVNKGVGYDLKFPVWNGSSCPFLYSLGGDGEVLEGEAFGVGLGRGMETSTAIVLKNLNNNQPEMKVKFTNERPETHYFNYIEADAIEHDKKSEIISDNNENYVPVYSKTIPVEASANGINILSYINIKDNKLWQEDITPAKGFRDTVYLTFDNFNRSENGTLIVDAINTYFGTYTYYYLNDILGDKYLEFMDCIETDHEVIKDLRDYLKESSLNIEIYNGKDWEYAGAIKPEANFTSFTKAIRFKISEGTGNRLNIRMTALKDVWKIDNVCCDFTKIKEPIVHIQKIVNAFKNNNENILNKVNYDDSNYCVLFPNDKIDIDFLSRSVENGKKITYAIKAKGYLQPWPWGKEKSAGKQFVKIEECKKIEFVKNLIKNRDYFLPVVYSEWNNVKQLFYIPR
jgi:hypothetical protein